MLPSYIGRLKYRELIGFGEIAEAGHVIISLYFSLHNWAATGIIVLVLTLHIITPDAALLL